MCCFGTEPVTSSISVSWFYRLHPHHCPPAAVHAAQASTDHVCAQACVPLRAMHGGHPLSLDTFLGMATSLEKMDTLFIGSEKILRGFTPSPLNALWSCLVCPVPLEGCTACFSAAPDCLPDQGEAPPDPANCSLKREHEEALPRGWHSAAPGHQPRLPVPCSRARVPGSCTCAGCACLKDMANQ